MHDPVARRTTADVIGFGLKGYNRSDAYAWEHAEWTESGEKA